MLDRWTRIVTYYIDDSLRVYYPVPVPRFASVVLPGAGPHVTRLFWHGLPTMPQLGRNEPGFPP
jgi:hypothetical protein